VAGFKSAATTRINTFRHTPRTPVWQTRFHDHIIRNEEELNRIRDYVINNPARWETDTHYTSPLTPAPAPPRSTGASLRGTA